MAWDYADLSKAAKEAGGPEKLMELLIESGKETGRSEMIPVVIIAVFITMGAAYVGDRLVKFRKKKISQKEVESAKSELVRGIMDYDATHTVKVENDTIEEGQENNE